MELIVEITAGERRTSHLLLMMLLLLLLLLRLVVVVVVLVVLIEALLGRGLLAGRGTCIEAG